MSIAGQLRAKYALCALHKSTRLYCKVCLSEQRKHDSELTQALIDEAKLKLAQSIRDLVISCDDLAIAKLKMNELVLDLKYK